MAALCDTSGGTKGAMSSQLKRRPPEVDDEFAELILGEMGAQGDTLAHHDGQPINVFGGIPGEVVVARIVRYRRKRKRYTSAVVTEVLEPSPHRVSPPCPYFGPCTGCQWQHIDYPHQLALKREAVEQQIRAFPELDGISVAEPMPSPQPFGYRNHARFTVRQEGSLGYINRVTRRFVRVDDCMLMSAGINDALHALQDRVAETSQLSVRHSMATSEYIVQPTLENEEIPLESGQTHYREELLGRLFRIASPSFFQVNTEQAERLIVKVRDRLELTGAETLIDAYAGVGTFAALLAPSVRRVIAVEESEAAVKDAAINTLGIDNLEFHEGKTEDVLSTLDSRVDAVIFDPPRAGCDLAALEAIVRWAPRRIVYVSCEPETLARDLRVLVRGGLRVEHVEPIDMFPQTHHTECVATLTAPG